MPPESLRIDDNRLMDRIERLGEVGLGKAGVTRVALTDEDRTARDLVRDWMIELGLEVSIDRIGNIHGVRPGRNGDRDHPVVTGSHIDSVVGAGKLDGCYGVLAGLEAVATLNENDVRTNRPIGVSVFTNEEGIRYQPDMMGSLVAAGGLGVDEALESEGTDGTRLGEELARIGYAGGTSCSAFRPSAFVELHVEQGPVLDVSGEDIGVVQNLQGISWTQISIEGEANHAGTTPMALRRDAGLAAGALMTGVRQFALEMGGSQVATVGSIEFEPNAINVIPASATVTVDLRNASEPLLKQAETRLDALIQSIEGSEGVTIRTRRLARFQPVEFDADICNLIEASAGRLGLSARRMTSGAGHDAQMIARLCPTAMIFVPSIRGISHNAAEATDPRDLANGAQVLFDTLLQLANR